MPFRPTYSGAIRVVDNDQGIIDVQDFDERGKAVQKSNDEAEKRLRIETCRVEERVDRNGKCIGGGENFEGVVNSLCKKITNN